MFAATARVHVHRPITEVFAFVEDARNRPQWDDTVINEEIISAGPIAVGTTVRTRLCSMGREYTCTWAVTDQQAPERITIESVTGPLPSTLQLTLTGDDAQAQVEFTVNSRPTGFMRPLQAMMACNTQRDLDRNFERLGRLLETGSVSEPAG